MRLVGTLTFAPRQKQHCAGGANRWSVRSRPGMRHFAVVVWHGDLALLDPPAIVCRALHPMEDPDLVGRPGELEQELELYKRGYLMCECFSQVVPEGEFGYRGEHRLYAISRSDVERAVGLLRAASSVAHNRSSDPAQWKLHTQ